MELTQNRVFTAWEVAESYRNPQTAEKYSAFFCDTPSHIRKDKREKRCIAKMLAQVPRGAHVLDLPCGAGRMYPLLNELGFRVFGADASPYMVDIARRQAETLNCIDNVLADSFHVADILKTGFADKQFDAVLCNRLFHHFSDSNTRQSALRELSRICSGPIVVSFFSTFATDALKHYYKKYIRREVIKDRIPISPFTFAKDIRAAGLKINRWYMARPLISKQWYVVLRSEHSVGDHTP
jgi:ubiquinone/menaquinone biosynthesis C-methylase UbiE